MNAKDNSLGILISQARQGSKHQVEFSRLVNRIATDRGLKGQDRREFIKSCRDSTN